MERQDEARSRRIRRKTRGKRSLLGILQLWERWGHWAGGAGTLGFMGADSMLQGASSVQYRGASLVQCPDRSILNAVS